MFLEAVTNSAASNKKGNMNSMIALLQCVAHAVIAASISHVEPSLHNSAFGIVYGSICEHHPYNNMHMIKIYFGLICHPLLPVFLLI